MDEFHNKVNDVLENPFNYIWELQGFGMLRTYIDKNTRLQIWLKEFIIDDVTDIHTHPWDFNSLIYQGEIINHCYEESETGIPYNKCLIVTGENAYVKESNIIKLKTLTKRTYKKGDIYFHNKDIPHRIDFKDGTITILTKSNIQENSLAYSYANPFRGWVSAAPRLAKYSEVKTFINAAQKLKNIDIDKDKNG
jgi:hypothetical protein